MADIYAREFVEFEHLYDTAKRYADNADLLSDALETFESFLQELPGKVQVCTKLEDPHDGYLTFRKVSNEWMLTYHYQDDAGSWKEIRVSNAGILVKAQAAKLLPEFYEELKRQLELVDTVVSNGLASICKLPGLKLNRLESEQPRIESIKEAINDASK